MNLYKRFKRVIWGCLILLLAGTAIYGTVVTTGLGENIIQAAQKIKYIGKDKYQIAKKEHAALLAKKKKLVKQEKSTKSQVKTIKKQQKKAQQQAKQQEQVAASESSDSNSGSNRGDMNTASTGQIVGNKNSHIYHLPGQRGYNMNSNNAVYFQNEQEAINAGYRKAKV